MSIYHVRLSGKKAKIWPRIFRRKEGDIGIKKTALDSDWFFSATWIKFKVKSDFVSLWWHVQEVEGAVEEDGDPEYAQEQAHHAENSQSDVSEIMKILCYDYRILIMLYSL